MCRRTALTFVSRRDIPRIIGVCKAWAEIAQSRTAQAPASAARSIVDAAWRLGPALDDSGELLDPLVDVGDTDITEPIVGVGAAPSAPFMAIAVDDSVANPTEAGFARYTEYTFFCEQFTLACAGSGSGQENVRGRYRRR